MKDYWKETTQKRINKKKVITTIVIVILAMVMLSMIITYCNCKPIREWIDKNVFRKEVIQDKVSTIELIEGENTNVHAFNKYIGVLNKNKFVIYGNNGNEEKNLEVEVSNPIFDSIGRFLVIAEKSGKKLYLINDKDIIWGTQVEGNISQVHINKNGYVAVVITDTSYKTVIVMYNPDGKEMFKTYLSSTRTADVTISNHNKYLAIAEVDTSGTMIQSNIKIISIDKASSDPTNSL